MKDDKIIAYKILESNSISELIDMVNILIGVGWEPLGGIGITHEHKDDKDFTGVTVFFQSMVVRKT